MKAIETLEEKLKELQEKLDEINKKREIFEQEIKKIKEHKKDEKLNYLNEYASNGIKDLWVVKGDKEYIAIDTKNNKYKYVIEIDDSDSWWFCIYKSGGDSKIPISRMFIYKYELSFEKFIDYIVYPIVRHIIFKEDEKVKEEE